MRIVELDSPDYPAGLKHISQVPPRLWIEGLWPLPVQNPADFLAIVGTRRPSAAGIKLATELARAAAREGLVIVSGLAYGIDAAAHAGALAGGGLTAAVMATGIDLLYPAGHSKLASDISVQGSLITEFPPGTNSWPVNFPKRNRLISGLSAGVVVIDAPYKSGAMITAKLAADQGREVMAVPVRPGDDLGQGPNWLIKQGAALVENIDDILAVLGRTKGKKSELAPSSGTETGRILQSLTGPELELLKAIGREPVCLDEIIAATQMAASQAAGLLLDLQLKGLISEGPGRRYYRD